jgi:hypothetical protein
MIMSSAAGKEIAKHRVELEAVLLKIANEHSFRCELGGDPCQWQAGWLDGVLCDLEKSLERYHVRMKAAA